MQHYRVKHPFYWVALFYSLAFFCIKVTAQQSNQPADVILNNGKILTVDKVFSIAEAIAIRGDRIAAVGSNQDVMALSGPNTQVFDLKGKTVIPGMLNTHVHINDEGETNYGGIIGFEKMGAFPINWSGVTGADDVVNQVKLTMEKYKFKPGEWIYFASKGTGMTQEASDVMLGGLTRWDLDKATPNNPIVMGMNWPNNNGVLVNSEAIDLIWPKHEAYIKKYGRFWIDKAGKPDGHMEPPANRLWLDQLSDLNPEDVGPIYKMAADELNAEGVTGISVQLPHYTVKIIQWMESNGRWNNLRFGYGLSGYFGTIDDPSKDPKLKEIGKQMNKGSEMFWVVSAGPTELDGSGSRVCSSQERHGRVGDIDKWYPVGQCSLENEYNGGLRAAKISGNYFKEWLMTGARDGYRFANTHVAGDRAVKLTINLMEEAQRQLGPSAGRGWAVDHCRMVDPADIPRAAKVGLYFSCAPSLGSDSEAKAFGDKVQEIYPSPVKSMLKAGLNVSVDQGSFTEIERFATRKDKRGRVWNPSERLTRTEALQMITRNGANYMLRPDRIGSLETGKFADLVILDKDYMTIPEEQIHTIEPQMTMVAGKIVWAHPDFVAEYSVKTEPGMVVGSLKDLKARRKPAGISRR